MNSQKAENYWRSRGALALILALFIASAMLFVTRPGIEVDEAVVSDAPSYLFHGIPVMNMSYVGALKSWFYYALFSIVKPGALSLRIPMVLCGALSVWLFFRLLDRAIGRRAAWIGALLLATDSMFVILEAIDFGPDALHFVFKLSGMVMLVRFYRHQKLWALAGGFFLFGLGMWDKVIFAWALFGIFLATLIVFPREIRTLVNFRNLGVAAIAFVLGALPLIVYNIDHPFETFKMNVHVNREPVALKLTVLERTMNGAVLFGFFTSVIPPPHPGEARNFLEQSSRNISDALRHPTHNLTIFAFCLPCLGLFTRAARKPVLFGLIACVGTWIPMAFTAGAGAAAHHVILLWPFHFLAIAAALAAIPVNWIVAALTAVLCVSNLAVTNEYYWQLVRNGPDVRWTDAINPLERQLETLRSPDIYIVDWGIFETLNLLGEGSLPIRGVDWANPDSLRKIISDPRTSFVAHTPAYEYFPQQRAMLEDAATSSGYEEVPIETIYDRYGRPTFDVFRFRKIPL